MQPASEDRWLPLNVSTVPLNVERAKLTFSNPYIFVEYLTESGRLGDDMMAAGEVVARKGGMHMEDTAARKTQLLALLMTVCVVGGALVYAMSA